MQLTDVRVHLCGHAGRLKAFCCLTFDDSFVIRDVKLIEGVGIGATEAEVGKWFAGFTAEPHKYEDSPAKYLTAPNARPGESALRFEIGQDGKVKLIHVSLMPVLAYVEGCG